MHFVIEYPENQSVSDYWLDRHALILIDNLEQSYARYLEITRKWFPTHSDKFNTIGDFTNRILAFYDRKERKVPYYLDMVLRDSTISHKDKIDKLSIGTTKVKNKNVGTQLNLDLF
jgi:hypothetical protein